MNEELENLKVQIELLEPMLTEKQRLFITEFFDNGKTATQAVIDAGYKIPRDSRDQARFVGYQVRTALRVRKMLDLRQALKAYEAAEVHEDSGEEVSDEQHAE